MDKLATVVQVK